MFIGHIWKSTKYVVLQRCIIELRVILTRSGVCPPVASNMCCTQV